MGLPASAVITMNRGHRLHHVAGQQITERGIGNGISLIIFAGIMARMPNAIAGTLDSSRVGQMDILTFCSCLVSWSWWWR
jgi:preprotein translocase subunit SecY